MGAYAPDREWADRFIPKVKQIVGPHLLGEAANEIDVSQATDLMILTARDMRIAARVRRYGFAQKYLYEFTIRSRRENGAKTELAKIVDGWGDWFFYGHADICEVFIEYWWLIDLHSFRAALIRNSMNGTGLISGDKKNGDGTFFKWFDLRSFPEEPPILISSSQILPALDPQPSFPFDKAITA